MSLQTQAQQILQSRFTRERATRGSLKPELQMRPEEAVVASLQVDLRLARERGNQEAAAVYQEALNQLDQAATSPAVENQGQGPVSRG